MFEMFTDVRIAKTNGVQLGRGCSDLAAIVPIGQYALEAHAIGGLQKFEANGEILTANRTGDRLGVRRARYPRLSAGPRHRA
jgi:hypothetical protein